MNVTSIKFYEWNYDLIKQYKNEIINTLIDINIEAKANNNYDIEKYDEFLETMIDFEMELIALNIENYLYKTINYLEENNLKEFLSLDLLYEGN